jgi:DNA-directed RNA polymerase specialized sigma24 family protein
MDGIKIEGFISKKTIKRWLEDYEYLTAGDRPPDAPPTNGGPKPDDGITNGQLNKLMLDQAINDLPPLMKACVKSRYVYKLRLGKTLKVLGISGGVYYERCRMAIDHIYAQLNGEKANYKALFDKIIK